MRRNLLKRSERKIYGRKNFNERWEGDQVRDLYKGSISEKLNTVIDGSFMGNAKEHATKKATG